MMRPFSPPHRCQHARGGFTLIELLVAAALVAILAAIALPAFFEQLARARRTDVETALLEDAGYMQRYYGAHNGYTGTAVPQLSVVRSPRQGSASYDITVNVAADDPSSFVLTARRTGAMSSDACGD